MTRTVICGVDHAPRSSTVVEAAATLADGLGAELVLAHSRQAPSTPLGRAAPHAGFAGWPPLEPDTETSAEELHSELLPYGLPGATSSVALTDEPGRALCELASDRDAALIVVGSRGRGLVRRFLLGSVSAVVIRKSPCPVMVVPDTAMGGVERPVVDGSTVVCGVGSPEDRRLTPLAADLADALGLRLRLVHIQAIGSPVPIVGTADTGTPAIAPPGHSVPENVALLQEAINDAAASRPGLVKRADWSVGTGMPADGLHKLALSSHAALVVVGTDSAGAGRSPAWRLAREGRVPVVIAQEKARWPFDLVTSTAGRDRSKG
jgi:nucleotide-binding universal stress UspA family protein